MDNQFDFSDIAPYSDDVFHQKMESLVKEPGFEYAVKYVMPHVDYQKFVEQLLSIRDKNSFQIGVMAPFLEQLEKTTTDGISFSGIDNLQHGMSYTFMSNHRDIVLDASFLNLMLIKHRIPTSEIAIGSNLLIYDWITDLVKLNKSFIVKRGIPRTQALEAARQLSAYIHYAIIDKRESVWIAQREGRAKDSNDVTQESLVKMLGLEGGDSLAENIMSLNILPLSISYEYDPNDYLKAKEFLLKSKNPDHKKSEHDDLLSMETGILKSKGRVHFHCGKCISPMIAEVTDGMNRIDTVKTICQMIDCAIHAGYRIYPINYIAYEAVSGSTEFADKYTAAEKEQVYGYWNKQLDKLTDDHFSVDDRCFMLRKMQEMYANPLINQIKATTDCSID